MSVLVVGSIRIDPARVEECKALLVHMMRATRAEPGCRHYSITPDLEEDGLFHVGEVWESDAALARHFQTPHLKDFMVTLRGWGIKSANLKRYEAGEGQPLPL